MAIRLQELIHQMEVGGGYRYLRFALGIIAMVALAVAYNLAAFSNLSSREAMDSAQLARNIAEGRGYTTSFIRPFSIYLIQTAATNKLARLARQAAGDGQSGAAREHDQLLRLIRLQEPHPDLANPPVYPLVLAGVLKLMPFKYPDLTESKASSLYTPDLWIALFNQALLLVTVVLVFGLAKKLFDEPVAWAASIVLLGSELLWHFSIGGTSTMLLLLIFVGLARVLASLEPVLREGQRSQTWQIMMSVMAGALVGAGGLTRYSFGWLIIPVVLVLALWAGQKRWRVAVPALLAFLIVMTPWLIRNYSLSGTAFGTAGFALCHNTPEFPGDQLERSLNPEVTALGLSAYVRKFVVNCREVMVTDLPKLGGSWVSAFFLVGLLVPFRNPILSRLRWFLVLCLPVLVMAQALGRTNPDAEAFAISSENLLVIVAPLIFIYGAGLFFILLDQLQMPSPIFRYGLVGASVLLVCASMLLHLVPPRRPTIAYPPYYPLWIQEKSRLMRQDDLIMSDVPWAVAWYGDRSSVWLTLNYKDAPEARRKNDFYEINDYIRPINGLYLTILTTKSIETLALLNLASRGENKEMDWQMFVLGIYTKSEVPTGFPLKRAPERLVPEIFLTDTERGRAKTIQSQ